MADKKAEALKIIEEGIKELESAKGSATVGVQKLSRAARLLDESEIHVWAELQLANPIYIKPVKTLLNELDEIYKRPKEEQNFENYFKLTKELSKFDLNYDLHISPLLIYKRDEASGGLHPVNYIEENYNLLIKNKKGNDGELYQKNLKTHLIYIQKTAHQFLTELHEKVKFSGTITSSFDLLKNAVDDRLLDLDLEIAEQLMLAFKAVSSDKKEEWSHALTTCRRLLESLSDILYPANELVINRRTFKQGQFVNRLWQFMNDSIESDTNKELAQAHVNYLGQWLEKTNKITNKGVHDDVTQLEATKAVFHLYLMLADLLESLDPSTISPSSKPNLSTASLDEIEVLLEVNRNIAKEIYKARIKNGGLTLDQLREVKGVGAKTLARVKEVFEF